MQWLLIFFACLAIGCTLLWYLWKSPFRNVAQDDLIRYFDTLLNRGVNGAFMVIEVPRTQLFIQFSKYVLQKGQLGLQFDFPRMPWSESYFASLKHELIRQGYEFAIEEGSDGMDFVTVDLGQDTNRAVMLAKSVLQSVFGLSPGTNVNLYLRNVSPRDEKIGF